MIRHEWNIDKRADQIILNLLLGYYLGSRQIGIAPGAILFGRTIEKNIVRSKEEELLDPYILEFLYMGWFDTNSKKRKPVVVITCEKRLAEKLDSAIEGALKLKGRTEESVLLKSRRFDFVPGILIIVGDSKNNPNKKPDVIKVVDRIREIEAKLKDGKTHLNPK